MPNPKYYQITLPSGSTQIWDEEKVTRNKKWLEDKKATSEEVNQFEVTLPSGASQTWDADKYGRNIDWLNEHQASVRGSFLKDQQPQAQPAAEVKPEEPAVTAPPVTEPTKPATDGKKETKPVAPSFGLKYDPEHPWRIQKPGYETSPMPEEYRNKSAAEEDPLDKGFDDEPQGPTWDQRQQAGNRKQVVKLSGRIDTMLNDAVTTSMQNYQREQQEMDEAMKQKGWFTRLLYFIGKNGGRGMDPGSDMMGDYYREFRGVGDPELQNRIASLNAAKKSMTNAQRMIAEADHNAQAGTFGKWLESSFLGGAARGFGQKLFDVSTWDMGMSDLEDAGAFMTALNAFDKGQQLTEAQQVMLDAKAVELATNAYFGSYVGRGYKAGSVTAESIPFMLEMCINPASSIGEAATSKMARYAISRFGKQAAKSAAHKAARAVGRAGADLAGAAIMSATTGAVGVAADAMERMNGEVTYDEDVTAPGVSAFADHTPGEAPAVAIAKAFGSRTIENYSEMVGEYFAPVLGAAGHGVQKGLEKIGLGKVSQFIDDVAASDVGRLVSDFEHNAKWNGVFGEYAEEVVGSIMNALTVGDQTLDAAEGTGVFNLDQNIDTFLGVALMGGFMSGIKTAGYRTPKYRTRKGLERADNAAGAAFDGTDWWEDIRNGIQANPDAALHDVLTSDALNPQQRRAAIEYAKAYQEYDGVLKAEAKRRTDEAADPRMNDLETSFDNGYELASEQEMNDARNMYQAQKARLQQTIGVDDIDETQALQQDDLPYSEEEKQTIIDYLNAKATYDGMIQRVRDDIDSRIEAAYTQIDLNTNATTGRIHSAVTSDDRKVYIVGGNVKLYEDGTIDRETSDKDIIIRDQETGQKEFWDIGMLKSIEAPIDPVDEKNTAAATVREQVARQAADKMDGRLHFQMGDVYTLTTPDGSSFPVQITANEQGIIDNGDGTVNVILNGATVDGQPVISQMPKEQIQQMSDATNLGRLAAYQQQKAAEEAAKPAYVLDDVLTLDVNGTPIRGSITADADADGRYEVYTEAPIDGKKVNLFTREQLDAMVSEKNGEAVTRTEMPVSGTENATSGTVSPENSTVQPENGTQAAPSDGTALSRIPVDENNVPQFEQAPLNDGWAALMELNDGNEQDTVEMANDMVVNAEAELQKAQKQKPKGTNPLEIKASRDEIRKAVAAAQNKVNFWKQIAGYPETLRKEMEAEARRQKRARLAEARKIQREQGRFGKEDRVLGDALSFEEYVMRTIANGAIRFKWGNDPNNAAIKGLGSHLGFTDNPAERNQRIWMLSNAEGLYPEAAAEELLQGYAEHLGVDEVPGMETMDAFSTLLDVLLSYGSSRAMFDAAKELHQKNDPNFLETKQAEMAAAMAEDEAKEVAEQYARTVPETPEKARGVIASIVELAKTVKDRVERAVIAALTPRQKQDFADSGIDVNDNFVHSIENSAILHNQKEHGDPVVEERRGQIAIEESDYALIPDILEDYDTVEKSSNKNKQGRDVIIYTKAYPDGTVYYLEEVRENRESLAFQTMYKKKSGSGSSDGLMQDAASPSTPVAPSDNSVSVSDDKGSEISGENNTPAENPTVDAIQAAREEVNTEPTEAQKEAGNYKKGHVKVDGYDISIENPKGSVRRGTSPDGTQWETEMHNDYGYIRSTEGVDGDHIDVYLSDNPSEGNVYVIDQVDPGTGEFDEHKVMYGFPDEESARAAYLANYEDGWQGLGTITGVSKDEFKKWVDSSHRKTKPFAEYKSVKPVQSDIKSVADEDAEKQEYVRAVLALDDSVNTGDVFTNDNGGTIRIIEKKPKHQGYMVEINTPAFAGTVENTPAELYRRVNEEGYRKQESAPEPPTTPKGPKRVNVESLLGALSQNGEAKLSDHVEEETPETTTDSVTIEPAQYTRKDGKTIDMYRVNPGRELSHEEWSAVSKFLKEKRGWKDRENGGFMVRSEEDARALADLVRDDKALNEARPVSLTDMQQLGSVSIDTSEVEAPKEDQKEPVWKYELTSVEGGRTYLSRSQVMPDGTEIYDGNFDVRADNPEEMKGILQNNGMYDTLSDFDKNMLDRKIEHWQFRQRVQNEGINGLHLGDKVMYKGKEATVHDFEEYEDNRPVLDTGLAPVIYEIAESWDAVQKVEAPAATPAAEEQPGETQPERPVNPSGNKLVTDERYAELRLKMMQKLKGQMNMGIDPEILAIGTEMAVYHIEKGARKFVEYAKAMIADLSDAIRPYLKAFYNGARDLPEMQESGLAAEMDSYADVQAVDVANFDKDRANVLDTVAAIEKEAEVAEQAQQGAEKLQKVRNTVASDVPASELEARRTFSRSVATEMIEAVSTGNRPFDSIVDLRKLAEKCGMTLDKLGSSDILLQELVEDGLVTAARDIIESKRYGGIKSREAYDAIVQLYEMQPSINQRSSNRIKMQQYSTPLPMAFVADMFAFHPGRTGSVLEPTAGNGMLVFAIPAERVHVNELDETRLANLREQGFREVTSQDGALPFEGEYDAVIANPPFGSAEAKEYDGVSISGLDPQIALNALASMSDTGKAAIIVGGNLEYAANGSIKGGKKAFFSYLYDHYNVKGIVEMSGDLYKRQGTKFPTMMILIDGRRSEEERAQTKVYPPVKSAAIAKVNNFDELYDTIVSVLQSKQKTNGYETVRTQELGLFDAHRPSGESAPDGHRVESHENDSDVRQRPERGGSDRPSGRNGGTGVQRTSQPSGGRTPGTADAGVSGMQANQPGNAPASDNAGRSGRDTQRVADGSVPASGTPGSGVAVAKPSQPKSQQPKEERKLTDEKLHYVQHSSAFSLESVAPAAMVEAMDATLGKIETKYGMSIDEFVTDELGYNSVEAMHNALAAEQVDSVAMAIDQMKQGQALVIGDQTGVGKGRQMAALIRWATRQGKQPIFVTQKATLFTDIYRDLVDIGSGDLNPFIFNDDGAMLDALGKMVYKPLGHDSEKFKEIMQSGELPPEYDFAVLTYSQVNTGDAASAEMAYNEKKKNGARAGKPKNIRPNPKADFLRAIAKDNYLFLDESHTAAGESKSGYYLQSLVKDAAAVTFASATFAKRPDTMPLYALRTAMSKAQLGEGKSLIGIIKRGGVTLQEIMSRALTTAGQMVRRERDMSDVQTDWETVTDPETVRKARENYDKTIEAFNDIINFQTRYVTPMIDALSGAMALTGSSAKHKQGTKKMGIDNVPFASKTYNYTKQLMLALKTDAIVDRVAKEIQEGRHPVIALESTMEALLKDYAPGEVIDNPTFAASLLRGLDTVLQYTVTDENGKETHRTYSPAELGEEGERAYYELRDKITEATSGIFISPLDAIIEGLQAKGFRVGELTGRSLCTGTDTKGRTVVRKRTDTDKLKLQMDFNSGALDVLILNKSASTGISLHASKKFKDQRQRSMIIAQPLSDINDYMQMIGRIDRTGQVSRGYYINLALPVPAEQRFNMMLSTKLKSLNANTTTSQDNESSSVEAPDLLNKYGSQVVVEYLRDNPDIYRKLGSPLKDAKGKVTAAELDEYKAGEEDARKITGYVALLSTKEQQDFYDDVIRRYNDLINYLNETGTNDLRITVMPLQAKTIQKTVSSEGTEPDGDNPFAQNAFVEKVEMNVLSKPMSADEIRKAIKKLNGDKTGSERRKEILKQLHDESEAKLKSEDERYEVAKAKAEEDIAKRTALVMAKDKMTDEEKQAAIEKFSASIREKAENAHEDNKKKYIASANALYHRMMYFDVGSTYLIADNLGTGGQSLFSSPAIFCGFKVKESKITASTTIAVFAPLDGRRRIEVKLSDMTSCNQIKDLTDLNYDVAQQTKLENWDAQIPNETRKEGYILTGNILQAIADTSDEMGNYTGQLVSFTDDEGNVRDGILMPDQWIPALLPSAGVPINARAAEIEQGRSFTSTDGNVSIQTGFFRSAGQPMYYYLSVPKSKAKGGKFFLNDELLSLLHGGEFTTRSGKMQATIWPDNLKPVLNFLAQMGVRVADSTAKGKGEETRRFRDGEGSEGIRFRDAFHGSAAEFEEFDLANILTGEGAAVHGWGHYVSLNKDVALSYAWNMAVEKAERDGLLQPDVMEILRNDAQEDYDEAVARYNDLLKTRQGQAKAELDEARADGDTKLAERLEKEYEELMSFRPMDEVLKDMRNLYTVDIPENDGHNYIDEMKTLPKEDRRRLAAVIRELPEDRLNRQFHGPNWLPGGFQTLANVIERERYAALEIRERLVDALGTEKAASEVMAKAGFVGITYDGRVDGPCAVIFDNAFMHIREHEKFRIREDEPPTKTGIGYKVFVLKNGQLYPPMVANPDGAATPVGVWLDADAAPIVGTSKTGRKKVKAGGKGTQGGSGTLAYRPGWHLGTIPYALQFNRKGESGERELFPADFVWAEVEYANDVDYQDEAMSYGYNEAGKFQHSLAGLPRLPENGSYTYRTNPDPKTDPWIITGAMKVKRLLTPSEVDEMVKAAGREPQKRQEGAVTDRQIENLNKKIASMASVSPDDMRGAVTELAGELGEKVRIIEDVNELKHTNPNVQRRMRNALGWYDTESGEVVVVLPNARSVADARATIFHETVAHKGLRELVGKDRFDDFLERVYAGATKKTREAINALAKRHGWDLAEGTEEYIARLAESGFDERENASFWEKVRRFFEDMISEAKLRLGFRITDNDLRYALWRSYQMRRNKGALGVAEDVDMQQRLGVGNFRDGSRRFRDPDEVLHDRTLARDHYEKAVSSGLYQFREAVQDSMLGLRTLMQSILQAEGKGKVNIEDVDAFENAYLAENAMSSMNKAEQEAYYKLVMSPLLKAVSDLGVSQQEVTEYMMAKHGLERNRLMAERAATAAEEADEEHRRTHDEWLEHFRKNDYAGLIGLTGKKTVRDAEREALRMVNEFEADHDTTDLWEKTNAATKASLQKLYESGLLTKAGFDHISDMYEYYIPLRGWDETTSDELYGYLSERRGVLNSPLKKAEGRRSKADDPLAYIASMADTAIMQGNRNRMKQRFLNFVLNHPSDLVSVNDIWLSYDDTTDEWKPVFADLQPTDTAEEVEQKVADFEAKMQALSESDPDHYKSGKDAKNIPFKVVHDNLKEHQVLVKRGGKTYVLTINGNPRAAQALNGLTNPDTDISGFVGSLIKGGQFVNRNLSAFYTTRNVEFVASNFMRDMLYSNCMTWVKESPSYSLRFHKNFGRMNPGHMLALFTKWENGTLDESDQTEKMFKQFMMNGGETGYTTVKDIEKQKKEIAAQIKKFGKTMPVTKAWEFLGTSFDVLNRAVENAARFAAFVTSREMGRTLERSVYDAKEISVNFNKKGAGDKFAGTVGQTLLGQIGSYGSAAGRLLYVFWNAGVQGLTNFGRAAKRHPGKAAAGMASMFALGMAIAALAASGGDGDDDDANAYYNLPEYIRRSNICFRAGNSWITIPLPIEFRGIYGMGELAMGTITGKEHYSDKELAFQIGSQVSQVFPLDMLEGGGGISPLIPSAAKPVVEAYIMNKSWTGMPIYKDTYFNKDLPNWTKAYKSANKQLVELAETANRMSGGDEFTKGAVDINPARVEYMLNGYFGGYSTLVNKLVKMAETATGQRDFEWRNMLVASRLVKSGDERTQRRKLTNDFFNIKDEAEQTQRRLRGYEDKADAGLADYAEKLDFLMNSPEYLRFEIYDEYSADLKDIREDMKEETDPEQYKVQEDEYYALMREMVDKVNESRESKR